MSEVKQKLKKPRGIGSLIDGKCIACGARCQSSCPVNCIEMTESGEPIIESEKCIGCQKCIKICPASALEMYFTADELKVIEQLSTNSGEIIEDELDEEGRQLQNMLTSYRGVWVVIEQYDGVTAKVSWELLGTGTGLANTLGVQGDRDSISQTDITSKLSDYLFSINSSYGESAYPQPPKKYLEDWANAGYLRKFYSGGDEPFFEPTPAFAKVIEWIQSLTHRQFVGTESRILTIFGLLQNMVTQTMEDPEDQIAELESQKAELQAQIDQIKRGERRAYDPTRIKEQFFQVEDAVRQLIGDFRQIEKNFRDLNAETKQKIATSDLAKGKLLDSIFNSQDLIRDNDQWKSFAAFWELMLTPERQERLDEMLRQVYGLDEIKELDPKPYLLRTRQMLIDAGGRVYKGSRKIAEQLRRYLESKMYLENRRIIELMRPIEQKAIALRDVDIPRKQSVMEIQELGVDISLIMANRLFVVPTVPVISSEDIIAGLDSETDADMLFMQQFIDRDKLKNNIHSCLLKYPQVSLAQMITEFPLEYGAAELVVYLDLAHTNGRHVIDKDESDYILIKRPDGSECIVKMCRVIFVR